MMPTGGVDDGGNVTDAVGARAACRGVFVPETERAFEISLMVPQTPFVLARRFLILVTTIFAVAVLYRLVALQLQMVIFLAIRKSIQAAPLLEDRGLIRFTWCRYYGRRTSWPKVGTWSNYVGPHAYYHSP